MTPTGGPLPGLQQLASSYDLLLCDIWGVLHNGATPWPSALDAMQRFRQQGGRIVLVSNSPRPSGPVIEQLTTEFGLTESHFDHVVTSGDVTRAHVQEHYEGRAIHHLGPARDLPLIEGLPVRFVAMDEAEAVLCSGMLDDLTETPEDYREAFEALAARAIPLICANPDKVVEMGDRLIYCAGALSDLYETLGGKTFLFGKPHAPIYEAALRWAETASGKGTIQRERVLAIGDSLRTDLRGAERNGFDALFITGGIHMTDLGLEPGAGSRDPWPQDARVRSLLAKENATAIGWQPRLQW